MIHIKINAPILLKRLGKLNNSQNCFQTHRVHAVIVPLTLHRCRNNCRRQEQNKKKSVQPKAYSIPQWGLDNARK